MKNIVITGVSTGIGYGVTQELLNRGYRVFGSVRRLEDAKRLEEEFGGSFMPLIMDLADHKSINKASEKVKNILGNNKLDGLINNAGATEGGPLIHMPVKTFQRHLDLLVTGQLLVTQAFFPFLKRSDKNKGEAGRIIMISSTSGKGGFPFIGAYAASKHALEGLSKSLRGELLMYGIDVVVIGPGNVKTPIWGKNSQETIEQYRDTDYYTPLNNMHEYLKDLVPKDSLDLDVFSRRVVRIFEKKKPKARYAVVNKPLKHWIISSVLPEKVKNKFAARILGMGISD